MNRDENSQNPQRDLITGEPASHPVGAAETGVAGSLAIGLVGGPLGAGFGAPLGAFASSLAGDENFHPNKRGALSRLIDFTVVDVHNETVGTVDALWEDPTGQAKYLAIRTGWLGSGQTHIIPARSTEVSESGRKIRLPYLTSQVKTAPSFDAGADITLDSEYVISSHFGGNQRPDHGVAPSFQTGNDQTQGKSKDAEPRAGERKVEVGGIPLRKIIRTEAVISPPDLHREDERIEPVPFNPSDSSPDSTHFTADESFIPLRWD